MLLSLLVVAIHVTSKGIQSMIHPYARIAVPMFFTMGSYFLFTKMKHVNGKGRWIVVLRYCARLLTLYGIWLLLLWPITVHCRGYVMDDIGKIIHDMLMASTFRASWYLMATVIGTMIVFVMSLFLPDWALVIVGIMPYALCTLLSTYASLGMRIPLALAASNAYPRMFTGFPASLLWISLGKCLAKGKKSERTGMWLAMTIACFAMLKGEDWLVKTYLGQVHDNDCYIMLVPTCICLFKLVQSCDMRINNRFFIRFAKCSSTIAYCLHASLVHFFRNMIHVADRLGTDFKLYLLVVACCYCVAMLCTLLEDKRPFGVLKLLH